ncbi:MAG: acyl-CoA synthetase [Rhodothermaceae bacterium]|nr:acyl-CoA synthetase [Rhodothermaceae bacterium]
MRTLIERAHQHASRQAIISDGKTYSYKDLLDASGRVASMLLDGRSDLGESCVAFLVTPGFGYVAVQWGIWRAGGIAVPLCAQHPLPALRYVVEDTEPVALVSDADHDEVMNTLAEEVGLPLRTLSQTESAESMPLPIVDAQRRAMILYTSGTTGKPKGVVTTHDVIEAQIQTLVNAWAWEADDHILNILPLHHVHGIINVLSCALWSGATCTFLPKFEAKRVWDLFNEGAINVFMAVPTVYYKLIAYWKAASAKEQQKMSDSLRPFRLMVSGSAALPVPVLETWRSISGHTLLERYGMTEIGMGLGNPYDGERRPGHVGVPFPGVQVRLVNEEGLDVQVGQPGEILIKSPTVFKEYWGKPEATDKAFVEGWFKTGDTAVLNNGYYQILGRNSVDIIKSGGYKISALQIEEVLLRHPEINECAVVGLPDEEWGEVIGACLVIQGREIDEEALKSWARERLPAYQVPRRYIVRDTLPRNTLGKVTKNEVKILF